MSSNESTLTCATLTLSHWLYVFLDCMTFKTIKLLSKNVLTFAICHHNAMAIKVLPCDIVSLRFILALWKCHIHNSSTLECFYEAISLSLSEVLMVS